MKKSTYQKALTEIIFIKGDTLMETWSIGVDNDPGHAIDPGEEGDIGAKEGFFFSHEEDVWDNGAKSLWDD